MKKQKCLNCKKEFWDFICRNSKFCSRQCHHQSMRDNVSVKCAYCKKLFYIPPSYRKLVNYCSQKCYRIVWLKNVKKKNKDKCSLRIPSTKKRWASAKADKIFSQIIRERANWKCEFCGKDFNNNRGQLHCSHFWGRGRSATRYNLDNCIAACYYCHYWKLEIEKQGIYRDFMLKRLGIKKYQKLEKLAYLYKSRKDAIKEFQEWYEKL